MVQIILKSSLLEAKYKYLKQNVYFFQDP